MKDLLILLAHLLTTVAKLLGPGGARAVVADSLLMKQQLAAVSRSAPDSASCGDYSAIDPMNRNSPRTPSHGEDNMNRSELWFLSQASGSVMVVIRVLTFTAVLQVISAMCITRLRLKGVGDK